MVERFVSEGGVLQYYYTAIQPPRVFISSRADTLRHPGTQPACFGDFVLGYAPRVAAEYVTTHIHTPESHHVRVAGCMDIPGIHYSHTRWHSQHPVAWTALTFQRTVRHQTAREKIMHHACHAPPGVLIPLWANALVYSYRRGAWCMVYRQASCRVVDPEW